MKNKLLIMILLLPIWMGCIYDFPADCEDLDVNSGTTYMGLRSSQIILPSDSEGEVESITIESLRILIFSQGTGSIVTNEMFDVANLPVAVQDEETGEWSVDFSNIVVKTRPGPSIVYVVLNENIMSISGQSLTGALNSISTLTGMENLVNAPLSYTTPLMVTYDTEGKPVEPPFIMSTFGECIILPGKTEEDPNIADLTGNGQGFELDRTMAKVTLENISSYPRTEGDPTDNVETSYIFILKVGLVNVAQQYLWSPNRPQSSTVPPVYTGSYQEIDFQLENSTTGYYDRTWNGSITATATATVTWTQYGTSERSIYKISKNAGIKSYSTTYNGYLEETTIPSINSGNFPAFFLLYFTDGEGGLTEFNQGNLVYDDKEVYGTIVPDFWELNQKNISYYIPEHILSDKTSPSNATKLHVRASIASMPDFDPTDVIFTEDDVDWGTTDGEPDWQYPPTETIALLIEASFKAEPVYDGNNNLLGYKHSWGGPTFYRYATGTIELPLGEVDFAHITDSKNIKDFYLPIHNAPQNPADYNIYRNHEYKFSVHALEQWDPEPLVSGATGTTARSSGADAPGSMVLRISNE